MNTELKITAGQAEKADAKFLGFLDAYAIGEPPGSDYANERTEHWKNLLSNPEPEKFRIFVAKNYHALYAGYLIVRFSEDNDISTELVAGPKVGLNDIAGPLLQRAGIELEHQIVA